jgi:prefoldin subunit 5
MDALMAQLDAAAPPGGGDAVAPPAAPEAVKPAPAAPETPPAKPEPTKTGDKLHDPLDVPEKPPVEAAKPEDKKGIKDEPEMSIEDMEKFLKAHPNKKPWKIYESLKTSTATKVAELEGKLKTLESKPVEAPGDAAKVAALEKQIEALTGETKTYQQRLAEADYQNTAKYKDYQSKINRLWNKAVQQVSGMQAIDGTEQRPANKEDFEFIRLLPLAKRRTAAREMFGDDAVEVLGFVNQIESLREENLEAQEDWIKTHEQNGVQRELQTKAQQAQFDANYKANLEAMRKNPTWGKWFTPDESDPEASKLLNEGFAAIEKVLSEEEHMTPEQAAAHAAVFRARAAAMPRMILEVNRQNAKITALEAELAKFRSTDPGSKGATAGGGGDLTPAKAKGIDGVIAALDSDPDNVWGR